MKNSLLAASIFLLIFASGCKKDSIDCQVNHWGTLKIHNSSSEDLRVYLDGLLIGSVFANTTIQFERISEGYHAVHAEQVVSHGIWDRAVSIEQCDVLNLAFTR